MATPVDAKTVKGWLSGKEELAFLDVSEAGAFAEGHPFFAVPLPYSRFELDLERLVPRRATRLVLTDGGDAAPGEGVAERAARRAEALGYTNVSVLSDGAKGWERAGYTLFDGVNLPSKTFGEIIEIERHTPRITATELEAMRAAKENMVIVDGRTWDEYTKFNIPGGVSCPNGELVLRIDQVAPDPKTKIVVNCAGRTRSIIGAQTLIDFGVRNPVVALENGTQGYWLHGLTIERGADRAAPGATADAAMLSEKRDRVRGHAERHGVRHLTAADVLAKAAETQRTTYLFDVRTPEEFSRDALPGFSHAPGGQLQQATDQWVGVKGARLIVTDGAGENIRAPMVAAWLRQLGHEADVLARDAGTAAALASLAGPDVSKPRFDATRIRLEELAPRDVAGLLQAGRVRVIDLRSSASYREAHIPGSVWSIRPRVASAVSDPNVRVVLVADDLSIARIAALDLREAGVGDVALLGGGLSGWRAAGLDVSSSANVPTDADRIDFIAHTYGRNDGNLDAARAYLKWETDLVSRLDADERAVFRV